MKHIRWSDDDRYFGPFTYAKSKYHSLAFILGSGEDDYPGCRLRIAVLGHTLLIALPYWCLQPCRRKVYPVTWDTATVARLGRDWYWDTDERELGFSYSGTGKLGDGGFLQVFYGRQTYSSATTKSWSRHTPWNNCRHVRHSWYGLRGEHFWTASDESNRLMADWQVRHDAQEACPSLTFCFTDYDGEFLQAKTRIEERQWEFGTGWFKWLSAFKKPIIHRSLDIQFSGETGKRKGSWKGGTTGHSIEMKNPYELHKDAFQRYCEEHNMTYKGEGIWTPIEWKNDDIPAVTDPPAQSGR